MPISCIRLWVINFKYVLCCQPNTDSKQECQNKYNKCIMFAFQHDSIIFHNYRRTLFSLSYD